MVDRGNGGPREWRAGTVDCIYLSVTLWHQLAKQKKTRPPVTVLPERDAVIADLHFRSWCVGSEGCFLFYIAESN